MPKFCLCSNCGARNPVYRSACHRCNAPLSEAEQERRERRRVLNELRESNGKDPLPVEERTENIAEIERSPLSGGLSDLFVIALGLLIIGVAVAHYVGFLS